MRVAVILLCLGVLLGVPLAMSPRSAAPPADALPLVVITPHNEQIRSEFAAAFDEWHQRRFGRRATIAWSTPGGTSEIVRMLRAQYAADLASGVDPGGNADLVFGGGSYEHGQMARLLSAVVDGHERTTTITAPVDFSQAWLDETYGPNSAGDTSLYDPQRHWFGLALAAFGIVYNREVLSRLGVDEPRQWRDLGDARLRGWVALVNPAQSGSVATAFDAILQHRGWEEGWRILRRAAANARDFSASAPKAPIDVSQGDAAAGICIDFYGRFQAQALAGHTAGGPEDRAAYIDPAGETSIDADPISMLRGAPHPQTARRFIEFCLSDEGQALWQFRARGHGVGTPDELGPTQFELRRLPIRRVMYERYADRMIDRVNPFEFARNVTHPDRETRAFISPVFAAMAMDNHRGLRAAWERIVTHPAYPRVAAGEAAGAARIITARDVSDLSLKQMLELFDAMPTAPGPDGTEQSLETAAHLAAVRAGLSTRSLWPAQADAREQMRVRFAAFFADNYERIIGTPAAMQP